MARIRSVHPDICLSETLASLSAEVERTFVRLWTYCDDEGRAVAHPKLLKAALYPMHDLTPEQVMGDIAELEAGGVLVTYEVAGKQYLQIKPESWQQYQKPARPTPSKLPPPPGDAMKPSETQCEDTADPADSLAPTEDSMDPIEDSMVTNGHQVLEVGDGDGDGDGDGECRGVSPNLGPTREPLTPPPKGGPPPPNRAADQDFETWWERYPSRLGRKRDKAGARQRWRQLTPNDQVKALAAIAHYAAEHGDDTDRDYAEDPVRWLKHRRWADYLDPPAHTNGHGRRHLTAAELIALEGSPP